MICLGDFPEMPNFVGTNPQAGKTGVRGPVLRRRQFRVGWGGAKTECKMNMLDNPLVWLMRIRHRCGYGVHSPFAFRFLTDVVYERTPYYAYSTLDEALPLAHSMRRRKGLHLIFRVANWLQPAVAVLPQGACHTRRYLQAGCRHAEECHEEQHKERSNLSTHSVDSLVINIVVIPRGLLRPYEFCVANVCQLTAFPYAPVLHL